MEAVTGEKISAESLGGTKVQASISGNVHFTAATEPEVLAEVRRLLHFLPQNNRELPDVSTTSESGEIR